MDILPLRSTNVAPVAGHDTVGVAGITTGLVLSLITYSSMDPFVLNLAMTSCHSFSATFMVKNYRKLSLHQFSNYPLPCHQTMKFAQLKFKADKLYPKAWFKHDFFMTRSRHNFFEYL